MTIRIVRLGTNRLPDEGLRIGTVRRPPRGVAKDRFAADNWYDAWLPELSPSPDLVAMAQKAESNSDWDKFVRAFRKEMKTPQASHLINLLSALSHTTNLSVGCYCEDENRCHRSVLRTLLEEHGANIT